MELLGIRPGNGPVDQKKLGQFTAKSKEIVRTFTGREPDETPNSTDSNIPLSLGIPANTIGTIDGGSAHTRQEWVDIASLPTGLKIVLWADAGVSEKTIAFEISMGCSGGSRGLLQNSSNKKK